VIQHHLCLWYHVAIKSEQLISAQKEELVLPCSRSFLVEEAENVYVCYFMKDEVFMRKW
jgi:hypothetical protein